MSWLRGCWGWGGDWGDRLGKGTEQTELWLPIFFTASEPIFFCVIHWDAAVGFLC